MDGNQVPSNHPPHAHRLAAPPPLLQPLVRDFEVAVQLLGPLVVPVQNQVVDGVVERIVQVRLVKIVLQVALQAEQLDLILSGLGVGGRRQRQLGELERLPSPMGWGH